MVGVPSSLPRSNVQPALAADVLLRLLKKAGQARLTTAPSSLRRHRACPVLPPSAMGGTAPCRRTPASNPALSLPLALPPLQAPAWSRSGTPTSRSCLACWLPRAAGGRPPSRPPPRLPVACLTGTSPTLSLPTAVWWDGARGGGYQHAGWQAAAAVLEARRWRAAASRCLHSLLCSTCTPSHPVLLSSAPHASPPGGQPVTAALGPGRPS